MKGWFDAFRTDGGPTLYSYSNRTPVTGDLPSICLYIIFSTIYIAFLIIFPGIRKERWTTFISVTLSVFVGFSICASQYGSSWHVADTSIQSYYKAFSKEKIHANLGIHIGLMHFNVTLQGWTKINNKTTGTTNNSTESEHNNNNDLIEDINFNERFHWKYTNEIKENYKSALIKGLPYPILTVAEYLNMDDEGMAWGRQYRQAGHYTFSFVSWILTMGLFLMVPRYGAYKMIVTGCLLLTTNLLYYILIPSQPIIIRFEDKIVMFIFGWDFWRIFTAGILCGLFGITISIIDLLYPHKFSTILEVDYDTPYDRHIILDQNNIINLINKKSTPSLEDPPTSNNIIRKIIRTTSSKNKKYGGGGIDNNGFELDPPKSPWRYPYLNNQRKIPIDNNEFIKNPTLIKLAAPNKMASPGKSVSFRRQSKLETTLGGGDDDFQIKDKRSDSKDSSNSSNFDIPEEYGDDGDDDVDDHSGYDFKNQFKGIKRTESNQSNSTTSSYGLGLLTKPSSEQIISNHLPLSRMNYSNHIPRVNIDKNSDNSRRGSNNSNTSSHVNY